MKRGVVRARFAVLLGFSTVLTACGAGSTVGDLNFAIMNDDLPALNAGIAQGGNVNGTNSRMKETPLHTAALGGNVTMARTLVDAGAEIEASDCHGQTPLTYAASRGHVAMSRYLIGAGSNVNRRAQDGTITCNNAVPESTPLSIAAKHNRPEVVALLLENGATAGGDRALAWSMSAPGREQVEQQLKTAGYEANDDTVRLVASFAGTGPKTASANRAPTTTASASSASQSADESDDSDLVDDAVTAAGTVALGSMLGYF